MARHFLAGFCVTAIALGALCGFAVVDLRTDRYMPGVFSPMFQLTALSGEGLRFSWMGAEYCVDAQPLRQTLDAAGRYAGLVPDNVQAAGDITAAICRAVRDSLAEE